VHGSAIIPGEGLFILTSAVALAEALASPCVEVSSDLYVLVRDSPSPPLYPTAAEVAKELAYEPVPEATALDDDEAFASIAVTTFRVHKSEAKIINAHFIHNPPAISLLDDKNAHLIT